jgi:hypothetical protein
MLFVHDHTDIYQKTHLRNKLLKKAYINIYRHKNLSPVYQPKGKTDTKYRDAHTAVISKKGTMFSDDIYIRNQRETHILRYL